MCNQLSKFAPNLADKTKPLRQLLNKRSQWVWEQPQRSALREVKETLTTRPVLALFNQTRETIVSADASSYGLGAVLLQRQQDGELKPISYISRSLTPTEQRYAQIEKEALAFTWACERFADFLLGMEFHIHTNHKPLVPLFGSKNLDELPIRVQRFRLRYRFTISHVPGASLKVADALSRAPCSEAQPADVVFERERLQPMSMLWYRVFLQLTSRSSESSIIRKKMRSAKKQSGTLSQGGRHDKSCMGS